MGGTRDNGSSPNDTTPKKPGGSSTVEGMSLTSTLFRDGPLYGAPDIYPGDLEREAMGIDVTSEDREAEVVEGEGSERAGRDGEGTEQGIAGASNTTTSTTGEPANDSTPSQQAEMPFRLAANQSGEDTTAASQAPAESGEEHEAQRTQEADNDDETWENAEEEMIPALSGGDGWNIDDEERAAGNAQKVASGSDCEAKLREARDQIRDLRRELDTQIALVSARDGEITRVQQERQELEIERDAIFRELDVTNQETEMRIVQGQSGFDIARPERELQRCCSQLKDAQREIVELKEALDECHSHGKDLEERLEANERMLRGRARDAREDGDDDTSDYLQENIELRKKNDELRAEVRSERRRTEAAEKRLMDMDA